MAHPGCKVCKIRKLCHDSVKTPHDDMVIVKNLIRAGKDLNAPDANGVVPIIRAVQRLRLDVVNLLIRHKADVNATWCGMTPLHLVDNVAVAKTLLRNGAHVHAKNGSGNTPLYSAVVMNRLDIVELLIEYGAVSDWRERVLAITPLHIAVNFDNIPMAKILIDSGGATVDARDESNSRPLHYAVSNNNLSMVDLLLNYGADPNCMNSSKERPVHLAIKNCNLDIVARLVAAGAYVKKVDVLEFPSLKINGNNSYNILKRFFEEDVHVIEEYKEENKYEVASFQKLEYVDSKYEVMRFLLKRGCDVYLSDDGENCLHMAVRENDLCKVDELLNSGADPNAENWMKRRPLHVAVENCNLDMVVRLIDAGADVDAKDSFGNFPLIMAVENNSIDILKCLLKSGANVNSENNELFTSVHRACLNDSKIEILKILLETGCNVNATDDMGNHPIHIAAHQNNRPKVDLLLKWGANPSAENSGGESALHLAVYCNLDVVVSLVNAGADINAFDAVCTTPLHIAARESSDKIVKFLLRRNADICVETEFSTDTAFFDSDGSNSDMVKYAVLCDNKSEMLEVISESDLQKYRGEVHKMRNHFIGESSVSLRDFLYEDDDDKLVGYFSNVGTMTSSEVRTVYAEPYPEYSKMIINQFEIASVRKSLLHRSKLVMCQSKLMELPLLVREKIFRLLTNFDLRTIVACNAEKRV